MEGREIGMPVVSLTACGLRLKDFVLFDLCTGYNLMKSKGESQAERASFSSVARNFHAGQLVSEFACY